MVTVKLTYGIFKVGSFKEEVLVMSAEVIIFPCYEKYLIERLDALDHTSARGALKDIICEMRSRPIRYLKNEICKAVWRASTRTGVKLSEYESQTLHMKLSSQAADHL